MKKEDFFFSSFRSTAAFLTLTHTHTHQQQKKKKQKKKKILLCIGKKKNKKIIKKIKMKKQHALFVAILVVLSIGLIVAICLIGLTHKWNVRKDVPVCEIDLETETFEKKWCTGTLLFVFSQGHMLWATGHVALVIRLQNYQQLYVWDMPNPLFHAAPTVCKPLRSYLKSCFKRSILNLGQVPRVYVQHLLVPSSSSSSSSSPAFLLRQKINEGVSRLVRNLASNATFDKTMIRAHLMFCLSYCFTGGKKNTKKLNIGEKEEEDSETAERTTTMPKQIHKQEPQKHTCTSSVLGILAKVGVFESRLVSEKHIYTAEGNWEKTTQNQNIYPHMFIHKDWSFDPYMKNYFKYTKLKEIVVIPMKKNKKKKKHSH